MCNFIFMSSTNTLLNIILNEKKLQALYQSKRYKSYILELAIVGEF